ncbi:uncharacterized protein [Argopecten irradians]|uniref:uncharacterized protein n=1 Tax=Argopecten irradians TaxID=31199 RepID=UPI0037111170
MVRSEEDIPKCQRIDTTCLMPETISIVENGRVHCVCDISRGYIGDDAFCIRMGSCSPGMELTKTGGRCMPCPQGTYKATEDYTFCQPHTSCDANGRETVEEGNAISDTVCGRYLQTTKQLKSVHLTPTTVVMTTLPDFTGKTDPMILKQVEPSSTHLVATQSDPEYSLSLLYVLVILVVVLQLMSFGFIVYRLNGRCFKKLGRPYPRDNYVDMTTITLETVSSTDDSVRRNQKERAASSSFRGVQVSDDKRHAKGRSDAEQEAMLEENGPATFYPPINEHPAEPTAPDLSTAPLIYPQLTGPG